MFERKLKHLEFIQNIVTRMNSNSFLIKGWSVTIVSALFALAAKDANINYALVAYIAIPVFWFLDGFYVFQERQFRDLFKTVSMKTEDQIDFNMDTSTYKNTWSSSILSKTIAFFYGFLILISSAIMFVINK